MLNKGGELFEFMGEFFKFIKKWFDRELKDGDFKTVMDESDELAKKYSINPMCKTFCLCLLKGYLEFLDQKARNDYD